jgi:hypothetical protein
LEGLAVEDRSMMRLTMAVWWSLALVWLLTGQVEADSTEGQGAHRVEIKGVGLSVEAAKKQALQEAVHTLKAHLRQQQLQHWEPTEPYVQTRLLDGPGHAGDEITIKDVGAAKSWVVELTIPANETLERLDRQARRQEISEERMSLLLKGIAGLVVVLSVLVGTIRLDEWTSSRYTAWLRLTAVGTLIALAAAWIAAVYR